MSRDRTQAAAVGSRRLAMTLRLVLARYEPGSNLGRRGGKPATDRVSYCAACDDT
jgi:hypothetical protein